MEMNWSSLLCQDIRQGSKDRLSPRDTGTMDKRPQAQSRQPEPVKVSPKNKAENQEYAY